MNSSLLSSLQPMLAAPWHQRRNTGSMGTLVFVVGLMLIAPLALLGMALHATIGARDGLAGAVMDASVATTHLLASAANVSVCIAALLVLGWWALLVSNLLDQNRPVLASLVPQHPARLRAALFVAWAGSTAAIVGLLSSRFGAPRACLVITAPALVFLAVSVRWPLLWLGGVFAPLMVKGAMEWDGGSDLVERVAAQWSAQPRSITVTALAASIVLLAALIQSGGRQHVASDAARRTRIERFRMQARGAKPVAAGRAGLFENLLVRPYYAWLRRALARPGTSVVERLMLGLGPGVHWTASLTAVVGTAAAVVVAFALVDAGGLFFHWLPEFGGHVFVGAAVGLVPGVLSPALQVQARLHQTRREQDLLVLLPGVPRGAALSRRLGWQLTGHYVLAWAGGCLLMQLCLALARSLGVNDAAHGMLDLARWTVVGMLPVVAFQWRAWARAKAPSGLGGLVPLVVCGIVMLVTAMTTKIGDWPESTVVGTVLAVTLAWGVLRWRRMAGEPAALPASRLA